MQGGATVRERERMISQDKSVRVGRNDRSNRVINTAVSTSRNIRENPRGFRDLGEKQAHTMEREKERERGGSRGQWREERYTADRQEKRKAGDNAPAG